MLVIHIDNDGLHAARMTVARGNRATVHVNERHGSTTLARHEAVARLLLFKLGSIQM